MITRVNEYSYLYTCGKCHNEATVGKPVLYINTTHATEPNFFLCKDCLYTEMLTNYSRFGGGASESRECTNCGDTISTDSTAYCETCVECSECDAKAEKCSEHGTTMCSEAFCDEDARKCETHSKRTCDSCGEPMDYSAYCSASCAVDNGDDRPSCTNCYDSGGYYCSANCAIDDGGDVNCSECDGRAAEPDRCAKHRTATSQPVLVAAASTITTATTTAIFPSHPSPAKKPDVDDDGNVVIGGTEFRFG